ncbi:biotin/lipoyl-containing protein [Intrasporangium sp.]|uniref:biotin/lipoyl-containing protein n=1 Tax=Intrasporangium sp. TaxID=1925024 RepID=UPI0032218155
MTELYEVTIPASGSVENVVITVWLVAVGDTLEKGDLVAEISTEKVDTELVTERAGRVVALLVEEGDEVPVGTSVCLIAPVDAPDDAVTAAVAARQG